QKKYWLTLREAAKLVGRATCGEKWSDDLLDKPEDSRHRAVRKDLYSAFSSCEVPALFDNGVCRFEAKPEQVEDLCFTLHISEDRVLLGQVPGEKLRVELHADKLIEFLRNNRQFRSAAAFNKNQETKCVDWLASLMRRHKRPPGGWTKKHYQEEAQRK